MFSVSKIIAFELVSLKTRFYRERILVIGSQYVNEQSQDFRYYTKAKFLELKFFHSDQKIWPNYCRDDISSVYDTLTCWLSIYVLRRGFLAI